MSQMLTLHFFIPLLNQLLPLIQKHCFSLQILRPCNLGEQAKDQKQLGYPGLTAYHSATLPDLVLLTFCICEEKHSSLNLINSNSGHLLLQLFVLKTKQILEIHKMRGETIKRMLQ